jgi:glycosyltransferase involved in cell wall biosynthesis
MKILMTADTVGGVWTYAMELARALQDHDATVVLAAMGAPLQNSQRADVSALRNVSVRESSYKLEWMEDPWEDVDRAGEWLREIERVEQPDLVHLNGYAQAALRWRSPVVVVGHSCVRSWWEAVRRAPVPESWGEYTRRVRAGLHAADLVVAPSHTMLDALQHQYGPLTRSVVVHNGREGPFHQDEKAPYVMTAGRLWDDAKNVAALGRVADDLPWPIYVAGPSASPAGASTALGDLRPLGHLCQQELAAWLAHASIFALPARYEPFGLAVLEAARSGCALVLGDIPSLRELWGNAALYVAPDDDGAICSAIEWLCHDAPLRRELAARARNRSLTYTPARMATRYRVLYDEVLRSSQASTMETACAS